MRLFLVSAIALAFCVPAFAGVSDYEFAASDLVGAEGETVTSTISLTFGGSAAEIDGWQVAYCHDTELMELDEVVSLELADVDDDDSPAFEGIVEQPLSGYWAVGAIYSFATDTLAAGGDCYEASYILGDPGTGSLDCCTDGLDSDGIAVFVSGGAISADCNDADVTILSPFTYSLSTGTGCYDNDTGIGVGSTVLSIEETPVAAATDVNAFTVAISNDSAMCEPTGATEGDIISGASYFSASTTADSIVIAVIIDMEDFDNVVNFDGGAEEAVTIDYDTNPAFADFDGTDDPVITDHDFEDTDEVANEVAGIVGGEITTIVPNLENGTIEWTGGGCDVGGTFKRGDCDYNNVVFPILDALYVLEYGFTNGPVPPCLAAADCDGNGVVFPILDALYILEYGFTNGPAPPDPGPTFCGPDTFDPGPGCEDPDELGCT